MKKTTLMQLWKLNKKTNTPFLGTMDMIETLPFLSIYKDNYVRFDKDFVRTRGCFAPTWNRDIEDNDIDVLNNFKEDVDNLLFRNSLSYQRMYDALIAEYSPIENFDRYEEYTDEGTVKNTTTNDYGESMEHFDYGKSSETYNYGKSSETYNYGEASETYNYGQVNVTDVKGEAQQTNVLGAIKQVDKIGEQTQNTAYGEHTDSTSVGGITTSNTHRVAGYNGGLTDSESDNGNTSAHTDSTTYGAHNDSVTNKAYQNETNKDAVTNTITDAEHTETHTEDAKSDTHSTKAKSDIHSTDAKSDVHNTEAKSDIHSTEAKTDTSKLDGTNSNKHSGHLHGNIGVTTNQQMIESEIQLRSSYSIYLIIYNDIIRELCILEDDGIDAFTAGLDLGDDSNMEINVGNVSLKVVQTSDGVEIIAKDDTGTTTGKITNGTNGINGKDGVTPKFKVETDGDIYVDYSGNNEV